MIDEEYAPDPIDLSETSAHPQPGLGLIVAALVLPVITGVVQCFVTSFGMALGVSAAMVVTTAVLIAVDASRLGRVDMKGKVRESPLLLFAGVCLLWIVVYPAAMFRRRAFGGPNLGFLGLMVAIFSMGIPFVPELLGKTALPACTSPEVMQLLDQIVRGSPLGPQVKSIDGFREVRFDPEADVRHGLCTVHTDEGVIPVSFMVEWLNRDTGQFQVRIPEPELPGCTDPAVVKILARTLRENMTDVGVKSIDGHRETRYDAGAMVRQGECVVHGDQGDIPVKYVVEWLNRENGQYQVRLLGLELPSCTSEQVKKMVEQIVRERRPETTITSIDGHREIRYDPNEGQRFGECVVHTDGGAETARFVVAWTNREKGEIRVLVPDEDLPSCTSPEVTGLIETLVKERLEGATLKTIDGHRELRFDREEEVRHGECVVHTDQGDIQLSFVVEWQNRETGMYQVRLLEAAD